MSAGTLFALLLGGHLVGDWIVQTDAQAAAKEHSWAACWAHVLTYTLAVAAFVLPVWHDWRVAPALVANGLTHGFIDRRWPVRWLLAHTGSEPFSKTALGVLAADQALHISLLAILAAVVR